MFYGKEAKEYATKHLKGKKVSLEFDQRKKDKYGRTLAYVYLENGEFVNQDLVAKGYAKVKTYKPNTRYEKLLKETQREAKEKSLGIWGEGSVENASPGTVP